MLSFETLKPLAQSIKHQTEIHHLALEALIVPQIQAVKNADDYIQLLHLFYGYNKPVEQVIHKIISPSFLSDIEKRQKADLLLVDLKNLGDTSTPSLCTQLPAMDTLEQAMGALYVMEGSTLGGKSISQLLLKTPIGITSDHLHFFTGYGKQTGPMWMTFLEKLNTFSTDEEQQQIIHSANETFIKFKNWIQQQTPQKR